VDEHGGRGCLFAVEVAFYGVFLLGFETEEGSEGEVVGFGEPEGFWEDAFFGNFLFDCLDMC